jgi:hypothetical protein
MADLARAIRHLGRKDVDALVEVAFAEIMGLAVTLFVRCELHVEVRLAECDSHGGTPVHMPADIIDEGWLGRLERLARFMMEVASNHERVRRSASLTRHAEENINSQRLDSRVPMGSDPGPPRNGQGVSANGRLRCEESRIKFP